MFVWRYCVEDLYLCLDGLSNGLLLRLVDDLYRILEPRLPGDALTYCARQPSMVCVCVGVWVCVCVGGGVCVCVCYTYFTGAYDHLTFLVSLWARTLCGNHHLLHHSPHV